MAITKRINGTIWSDGWFGYQIENILQRHPDEEVHLVITSPGGEVGEAIRISDIIKDHGNVTIEFSGLAASAATWLGFAAKRVSMHKDTLWLCHQASSVVAEWTTMNKDELENYIQRLEGEKKSLEVIDAIIADKYLQRAEAKGKTLKDIVDLMKEERYLAPKDCLEWGFVDEIIEQPSEGDYNVKNMVNAFQLPEVPAGILAEEPREGGIGVGQLVNIILDKIKDMFEPKHKEITNTINKTMNTDFQNLNTLTGVEGFEQNEESQAITLTPEQMQAIENRVGELNDVEAELTKVTNALDAISPAIKAIEGVENKINALKAILDHVPASQAPQKPAQKASENNLDGETFEDPVNEMVKKYINK